MTTRTPIVGGNWKMHTTREAAVGLAGAVAKGAESTSDDCQVFVAPPFPYLAAVADVLAGSKVRLAAQNVHPAEKGAFTGEVAVGMLQDVGVHTVIVGHSERRHVMGETDAFINEKVKAAILGDLDVVLCVGETKDQRAAGETNAVVLGQLEKGLAGISFPLLDRLVIAYEPVWAIGTGDTATPDDAEAVHAVLRQRLETTYDAASAEAMRIQYGGSVKPGNAAELIAQPNIDGFLVGGASLVDDDFLSIIRAAAGAA